MIVQLPRADGAVAVVVRLAATLGARSVHLVGDFNGWSTSATPMRRGEHYWEARVAVPAGATCYYAYLIDGVEWRSEDPAQTTGAAAPFSRMLPIEILHARPRRAAARA